MTKLKLIVQRRLPPPGMKVPFGGSCCATCKYFDAKTGKDCRSTAYVGLSYKGKKPGDTRFIDGKTGTVVIHALSFCCNAYDNA